MRLRSRGTGNNGICPEWTFPGVFADSRPHQLLVTYAGSLLSVYVDGTARACSVHTPPAFTLVSRFLARDHVTLPMNGSPWSVLGLAFVYFALNLLPLAILLGLVAADPSHGARFRTMWVATGILLPPLILQLALGMLGARHRGNARRPPWRADPGGGDCGQRHLVVAWPGPRRGAASRSGGRLRRVYELPINPGASKRQPNRSVVQHLMRSHTPEEVTDSLRTSSIPDRAKAGESWDSLSPIVPVQFAFARSRRAPGSCCRRSFCN